MKSLLLSLCIFAAVIAAARGLSSEEAIEALNEKTSDNLEDQLENFEDKKDSNDSSVSNPHNCDCDGVCEVLHYTRLPKEVRVRIKPNFEILSLLSFAVQVKYLHIYAQTCSTCKMNPQVQMLS